MKSSTPTPRPAPGAIWRHRVRAWLSRPLVIRLLAVFAIASAATFFAAMGALWLGLRSVTASVEGPFDETPPPSRLYSAPLELRPRAAIDRDTLSGYLSALGYRRLATTSEEGPLARGTFVEDEDTLRFTTRQPLHPAGPGVGQAVTVTISVNGIEAIQVQDELVDRFVLEPVELHTYYDDQLIDRRPSSCRKDGGRPPEAVSATFRAAEDARFFDHRGVSVSGIARAALVNLKSGRIRQGGSTITQQLARNRFLTHERSWRRKAREALMALVLESRHDKDELLCAYADLVYFGVRDGVNVIGVGAAAATYFGKRVEDLTVGEAATLAGMIAAPARYSPVRDLQRARARRDWVLDRMLDLGWIDDDEFQTALAEELLVREPRDEMAIDGRYYAAAVRREVEDSLGLATVEQAGLRIDGTLGWLEQKRAEQALVEGLASHTERHAEELGDDFDGALVSVEPQSGAVRAYVGGRSYDASQFDRVQQARRQIGSLFKPIVYATAFAQRVAHPETPLADRPIAIFYRDELWTPKNSSDRYRGTVTAGQALQLSINSATLRLAASTGFGHVRRQATAFGLEVSAAPASVLGAVEASPWEMAEVYAAFARNGELQRHTTLISVRADDGSLLPLPNRGRRKVLDVETVHLVNTTLQGVLRQGTAARAWRAGLRDRLAGKTGTSNDMRDSWFVGYSPDRLTVVWTGRDGFGETPFTGTTGALPIWIRYTLATRPADGYRDFDETGLNDSFLDFENDELWPSCPDEILHPEFVCEGDEEEQEDAGNGYILTPRNQTRVASTRSSSPTPSFAAPRGLNIRLATRSPSNTDNARALMTNLRQPAEPDDYQLRDYFEISPRGSIVERAIERVPLTEDTR